jgi:hypothetical protein
MASKNSEFSCVFDTAVAKQLGCAEAASADCNTLEVLRQTKGISVESLIAFLQKIVAVNPAVARWPVAHVEGGWLEKTTMVEAVNEGEEIVLS